MCDKKIRSNVWKRAVPYTRKLTQSSFHSFASVCKNICMYILMHVKQYKIKYFKY